MDQSSKLFRIIAHVILIILVAVVIIPFLLVVSSSFTDEQVLLQNGYNMLPYQISVEAYQYLFDGAANIFRSYSITLTVTLIGTVSGLFITALLGYVLSVQDLPFRRVLSFYVFFTMLFNGGLVPTYMMYTGIFHVKKYWRLHAWMVPANCEFFSVSSCRWLCPLLLRLV
jgi:putative aldouronate transport system permease protein